jgi:hypothetical protein
VSAWRRGQTADVEVTEDLVLTASHDVLVTQFMVGSAVGCPDACVVPRVACPNGPSGIGDPSQLQIISSAHFAREYLVLVPEDYRENHVSIAAPLAARVTLDGAPVMLEAIGNSAMGAARVEVSAGLHRATADVPFGMYVYGYDCDVSYALPGRAALSRRADRPTIRWRMVDAPPAATRRPLPRR